MRRAVYICIPTLVKLRVRQLPEQKEPFMTLSDVLRRMPLFASLSDAQREALAEHCLTAPCARGKIFFMEGDEAAGLYILLEGKVKVFRAAPDGREAILHVFGPGEPFGEVAVFQGGKFPASAECVEAGRSLFLPRTHLLERIAGDPALALRMLGALSLRLRAFAAKVETLTLMETPQRLAAYLLLTNDERMEQTGGKTDAGFQLDISKALLAGLLGTARETLSRCLTRLVEQGAISLDGRTVRILDRKFLEGLAQGTENL